MTAPFDPIKAAKEELAGLSDVHRTLIQRERMCEEAMSRAEQELNAVRKLTGYARIAMEAIRQRIEDLEHEQAK